MYQRTRGIYNGGPHAGARILTGTQLPNEGGWSNPTVAGNWSNSEVVLPFQRMVLSIAKTVPQPQYQPGEKVPWTIRTSVVGGNPGDVATSLVVSDTLPAGLDYDPACTEPQLPAGVTVSYNPQTRVLTFSLGDRIIGSPLPFALPTLTVCTEVSSTTRPGVALTNNTRVSSPSAATPRQRPLRSW